MANTAKKATEIATIDAEMVTLVTKGEDSNTEELIVTTQNKVSVEVQTEETDAVKLVVKGVLRAQKKKKVTVTGNAITISDNVFSPELVKILQGGTITTAEDGTVIGYTPPVVGSTDEGQEFTLNVYTAQYDSSGSVVRYEKTTYPNCTGEPVAFSSEDGAFRAPEYVIDSAPKKGEAPYAITYVDSLPTVS